MPGSRCGGVPLHSVSTWRRPKKKNCYLTITFSRFMGSMKFKQSACWRQITLKTKQTANCPAVRWHDGRKEWMISQWMILSVWSCHSTFSIKKTNQTKGLFKEQFKKSICQDLFLQPRCCWCWKCLWASCPRSHHVASSMPLESWPAAPPWYREGWIKFSKAEAKVRRCI